MPSVALAAGTGFAQAYGGSQADSGYLIGQVGSNFVFGGTTASFGSGAADPWLLETDGNGNVILQEEWGTAQTTAGTVNSTPDGGYVVSLTSQTAPLQLIKLNSSFASVWQKQYGNGGEGLTSVIVLPDSSFLIQGMAIQMSGLGVKFVVEVMKTDASGAIVWQKTLSSSDAIAIAFQQLADGSFIGVGTIATGSSDMDALVVNLDSGGNITWQNSYGGPLTDQAFSAVAISGGYLIAGSTASFGAGRTDVWLLQLDGSGHLVKQETIGGAGDEAALIQPVTGGYLLGGATDSSGAGGRDGWLAFLDSNLGVSWSKTYGGPGNESLVATPDSAGGFLLEGTTTSFGGGGEDAWVIKTDASGTPIWQNAYGGSADDFGAAVRIFGGRLMLSGSTASWGAGGTDLLAALLDANGQLTGCDLVHPTSVTPANFPVTVTATSVAPVTTTLAESNGTIAVSTVSLSPVVTSAATTNICGVTAALTATAGASTTSGAAPLSVVFTGLAAGGTSPYGYDWDFGDGSAHSSQQNPAHTYGSAGSYNVTFKVTDVAAATATDNHLQINVSGATCTLTCQASVPTAGAVGVAVGFASSATTSNCGGSVGYLWSFGDGQTSTAQNPTHTYAVARAYTWTLTVTAGAGSCNQSGGITISSSGAQQTWIPVGSHASGLNQSQWRSDLGLLNAGTGSASVQITGYIGSSVLTKNVVVAAGAQSILTDIVGQLGGSGSGALAVNSSVPLKVTSWTYNQVSSMANCYPNGTQGQAYPAVVSSGGLGVGQAAYLAGLTENSAYRCNIGLANTGPGSATVLVRLYNGVGVHLADYTESLTAGQWTQTTQPFKKYASQTAMDAGYATVTVQSGSGVFAFASVIDNITNDPTTVTMQP